MLANRVHRGIPPDFEAKLRAIDDLGRLYRILEWIVEAEAPFQDPEAPLL